MPTAYTQNFYHAVFSTKHRQPLITADIEPRLYAFIGGIVRDLRCTLLAVNGMPDHVHLLIRYRALACVIREARRSWKAATWLLKYVDSKIASHEETPDERRARQQRESDEFFARAGGNGVKTRHVLG